MFERLKRFFGRKPTPAPTVAWEKPANAPPSARAPAPPPPSLAGGRSQEPMVASRGRSAAMMTPPSAESVMAAKRQQTASTMARPASPTQTPMAAQRAQASAVPPPPPAVDNRRIVKSLHRGERTDAKEFLNIANAGGDRVLRHTRAREVQLKTRGGMEDGINLLHRTGSVTQLQLNPNDSGVAAAKHHSKTTGQTFEVRARDMRGPAKRQLDRVSRRHDHRDN